ncbi:site-specific integrase [Synechococcus sp. BMK-MC-1]|uniref:site-specific integrase n=1 Tax=Synechococcus sp. BMK-MC-1 TaxID=1442551 RepID=UPI0016460308|nr:site-specific integrase [Synechococcus sp. BMK-MC-1]QNI66864.1 phage integrase family protein [Synechococcus sp. BMK-MC-1]
MEFEKALDSANTRLAAQGSKLRIEQRGSRLNLRGLLPLRLDPSQNKLQRISLGVMADPDGLDHALHAAALVRLQLEQNCFDWSAWSARRRSPHALEPTQAVDSALKRFEKAFFSDPRRRRSPSGRRTTWSGAYLPYLRRLSKQADGSTIDAALLMRTLMSYEDGSRSRQQCATALAALARFLEIPLPDDWREEAGGYGLHRARFRQLPTDRQILEAALTIPNPSWRLAYGLMATYGLRNHEVFFCDCSALGEGGDRVLRVLPTTKTGEHQSWPFHPEWVERFGLQELADNTKALPSISTDLRRTTLQQVGRRVSEQFRRYELPITPYDLRHAWAVRTIHIGLPDTVAARMMGHSVAIHTRTYHHWITRRDQQQAVDAALARHRA